MTKFMKGLDCSGFCLVEIINKLPKVEILWKDFYTLFQKWIVGRIPTFEKQWNMF